MELLKPYIEILESELAKHNFPKSPVDLYDPLRYFLNIGGKRIRPTLTLLGAELFGGKKEDAISQALAIEMFHNFTLIHDDIMDNAPLRRNQQTVHEKWNPNIGILSGDVLLVYAYQQLAKADKNQLPDLLELFNKTAIEVCEGQQMDMDFEERMDVSISEYIEMIRLKTSVLLGCSLNLGGIVANASKSDLKKLYDFGQNIGIAFQIQDDILDLYADPDKFGKQVGGDVIANKKTILHLTAKNTATLEQREIIKQLLAEQKIEFKVSRTRELYDHLNVKETCKELMNNHYQKALVAIKGISVPESNKESLIGLASFLMDREV